MIHLRNLTGFMSISLLNPVCSETDTTSARRGASLRENGPLSETRSRFCTVRKQGDVGMGTLDPEIEEALCIWVELVAHGSSCG